MAHDYLEPPPCVEDGTVEENNRELTADEYDQIRDALVSILRNGKNYRGSAYAAIQKAVLKCLPWHELAETMRRHSYGMRNGEWDDGTNMPTEKDVERFIKTEGL